MAAPLPHGGDLAGAEARFGVPAGGWVDLSTGINPVPYPVPEIPSAALTRLPDARAEQGLREVAAAYFGAPGSGNVALGPGSQALIQWLPRTVAATTVAIVSPTYGEHHAAWEQAGHRVIDIQAADLTPLPTEARVIVLVNPNNPDGTLFEPPYLLALAERVQAKGGLLVVDEAFADVTPTTSLAPFVDHPALVVLRSFGKFFGLAGVRLGLALASPDRAAALARAIGPWPVSGSALAIATAAYGDTDWIAATRARLARDRARLETLLADRGFTVRGGTDLFVLAEHPRSTALYAQLAETGILARAFPYNAGWLRFGLPGTPTDWARLEAVLKSE